MANSKAGSRIDRAGKQREKMAGEIREGRRSNERPREGGHQDPTTQQPWSKSESKIYLSKKRGKPIGKR